MYDINHNFLMMFTIFDETSKMLTFQVKKIVYDLADVSNSIENYYTIFL